MATTPPFKYQPMFEHGEDKTEYYLLTKDYVSVSEFEGNPILKIEKEGLTLMHLRKVPVNSDILGKDALATALHVYYLNRKYPHAELSLSCPRLRPIINNDKINPRDVGEKQLCQVLCAYRLFLPFVGITVSSRESAQFRNGITKICATKVSAGVSTGIGDHESKYTGKEDGDAGDEQFEINDNRSFDRMYKDMEDGGLQPVVNEYIYV